MDPGLLRNIGITIGAATLAGALAVATFAGDPQAPAPAQAPVTARPLPPAPVAEPTPASFLVRFQGSGPLGRAQRLAEQGEEAEARAAAEAALASDGSLRGLCFHRFTVGGAEMVLRVCDGVTEADRAQTSAEWLARLRDMDAVAYADMNAVASPTQSQ